MSEHASMGRLERIARAGRTYAVVSEVTRDPDPAPDHEYESDPQSGAGNCRCGAAERHRRHPHPFLAAASRPDLCTCALPEEARCHADQVLRVYVNGVLVDMGSADEICAPHAAHLAAQRPTPAPTEES